MREFSLFSFWYSDQPQQHMPRRTKFSPTEASKLSKCNSFRKSSSQLTITNLSFFFLNDNPGPKKLISLYCHLVSPTMNLSLVQMREGNLSYSESYVLERRKIQKRRESKSLIKTSSGKWTNESWCTKFDTLRFWTVIRVESSFKCKEAGLAPLSEIGIFHMMAFWSNGRATSWSTKMAQFSP